MGVGELWRFLIETSLFGWAWVSATSTMGSLSITYSARANILFQLTGVGGNSGNGGVRDAMWDITHLFTGVTGAHRVTVWYDVVDARPRAIVGVRRRVVEVDVAPTTSSLPREPLVGPLGGRVASAASSGGTCAVLAADGVARGLTSFLPSFFVCYSTALPGTWLTEGKGGTVRPFLDFEFFVVLRVPAPLGV